jgi:lactoylglutathione lyase
MDIIHTAIWVSDLERARDFYVETLGLAEELRHVSENGVKNLYIAADESDTQIQLRSDPSDTEPIEPQGIDHLELSVDNANATFQRAVNSGGATPVKEPFTAEGDAGEFRVAYVQDPDGYTVVFQETIKA